MLNFDSHFRLAVGTSKLVLCFIQTWLSVLVSLSLSAADIGIKTKIIMPPPLISGGI